MPSFHTIFSCFILLFINTGSALIREVPSVYPPWMDSGRLVLNSDCSDCEKRDGIAGDFTNSEKMKYKNSMIFFV